MLSADFVAALLELARLDHRPTQQRAIFAIVNLTYETAAHPLLLGTSAPDGKGGAVSTLQLLVDLSAYFCRFWLALLL